MAKPLSTTAVRHSTTPLAKTATTAAAIGTRERGQSVWLGQASAPVNLPTAANGFEAYRDVDRTLLATLAQFTGGLSPATLTGALADWWVHLAASPYKQLALAYLAWAGAAQLAGWPSLNASPRAADAVEALPQDKRFLDPAWQAWPFSAYAHSFLLTQQWWQQATSGVPGTTHHHEAMVAFGARQALDMLAPSNFVSTNPVVLQRTVQEGGMNLLRGALNAAQDAWRETQQLPPAGSERFEVGKTLATMPGQVILRNRLMELIQYSPTTPTTQKESVLLVPAWIMKYYILDLSPHNSLVKALVDQGFTVFAISWKNPTAEDRDLGLDDYFHLGIEAALDAIGQVQPKTPVHAAGYCLGGTLLAMAAAALASKRPQPFKTLTLLAAQTDFTDPGELSLFIDEGQVHMLDNLMWRQGFLQSSQMKSAFQLMRSQDLVWSRRIINHLLGERRPISDLMAWNADGTRLPYRMHSEYLHHLFLENALAQGQARLAGRSINLRDIHTPIFNLGTVQDHVAPWRSVFKLHGLTNAEQTFVLTAGGHNVGIVNPPNQVPTSYKLRRQLPGEHPLTADEWLAATAMHKGSWWTAWFHWLHAHSSGRHRPPPVGGRLNKRKTLGAAPGRYVHER
jgi:polyhydroxyalkanoate synthase